MGDSNPFAPSSRNPYPTDQEVMFRRPQSSPRRETEPSETDSLLGKRRTPPPRYSSIEEDFQNQLGSKGNETHSPDGNLAAIHHLGPPAQQSPFGLQQQPQNTDGIASQQPQNQNIVGTTYQTGVHPGWFSWLPGPGQYFPPGLEHLNGLDELTITRRGNKYRIWRNESHQLFTARIMNQGCCGGRTADATIRVLNNANLDVLYLSRVLESSRCCGYSDAHVEVAFQPGTVVGVVQGTKNEYTVHNPSGDLLFILEKHRGGCCSNAGFEIVSADRYLLGSIAMDKTSCCRTQKVMRVLFPPDFDLRSKALLLSAAISLRDLHWK